MPPSLREWSHRHAKLGLHGMKVLKTKATYQDLQKVPDHQITELIAGELIVSPRSAGAHTTVSSSLGAKLNMRFQHGDGGLSGWWIMAAPFQLRPLWDLGDRSNRLSQCTG